METWDVKRTAEWLCQIGLDKKYATTCEEKGINGRALLLLADRRDNKLMSVLDLKKGPQKVLSTGLKPYLEGFKQNILQTTRCSSKALKELTVKELCNWLRERNVPKDCLAVVETEEVDGNALLLLKEDGELRDSLQLKEGPWIVLEHELSLLEEESGAVNAGATAMISTNEDNKSMPKLDSDSVENKEIIETKNPLSAKQPSIEGSHEIPPMVASSEGDQKLSLLRHSLRLDINSVKTSENTQDCLVRSIFVKRGKGANALEKLFNFIMITKEEMAGDKPRKLWSKVIEKTSEWMKLLPENVSKSFFGEKGSNSFVHVPSGENLSLRDGEVVQIPLENISDDEYNQSVFIVLVDKQLVEQKKTYIFFLDKKLKNSYTIKVLAKSNYHAAFDPKSKGLDLKWSKYFRSLLSAAGNSLTTVTSPSQADVTKPSVRSSPPNQTPRLFNSEFEGKYYNEVRVLPAWETGSKDLITPVHEFKLLRRVGNNSDDMMKKFVYETLRFACGCLNGRTNGTIHFGVADEEEEHACGYYPRQIVGSLVRDKPTFSKKLTEFIDKCFVGDSRSNVHNCIRPPVFIPVKGTDVELPDNDRVVIEVDIEPRYSLCAGEVFTAKFEGLNRGRAEATAYIRHGSEKSNC